MFQATKTRVTLHSTSLDVSQMYGNSFALSQAIFCLKKVSMVLGNIENNSDKDDNSIDGDVLTMNMNDQLLLHCIDESYHTIINMNMFLLYISPQTCIGLRP